MINSKFSRNHFIYKNKLGIKLDLIILKVIISMITLMMMVTTNLFCMIKSLNPLNANPTKWSNTLKQFVGCC